MPIRKELTVQQLGPTLREARRGGLGIKEGAALMGSKDKVRSESKKPPKRTLKEKRQAKREKKVQRGGM